MNKEQFIHGMLTLFNKQNNEDLKQQYDIGLSTSKNVDWLKLYHRCVNQMNERTLPMPAWFKAQYDYCLVNSCGVNYSENNGKIVVCTLTDGREYEYELYNCSKSQRDIIRMLKDRFSRIEIKEDGTEVKITSVDSVRFFEDRLAALTSKRA